MGTSATVVSDVGGDRARLGRLVAGWLVRPALRHSVRPLNRI